MAIGKLKNRIGLRYFMKAGRGLRTVFRMIFIKLFSFLVLFFQGGRAVAWAPVERPVEDRRPRNRRQATRFTDFQVAPTSTQTVLRLRRFLFKRFSIDPYDGSGKFGSVKFGPGTDSIFFKESPLLLRSGRSCSFMTSQYVSASALRSCFRLSAPCRPVVRLKSARSRKATGQTIWNLNKSSP